MPTEKDFMLMDMIAAVAILAKVKPEDVVRVMHKEKDQMKEYRTKMVETSFEMLKDLMAKDIKNMRDNNKVNKKK